MNTQEQMIPDETEIDMTKLNDLTSAVAVLKTLIDSDLEGSSKPAIIRIIGGDETQLLRMSRPSLVLLANAALARKLLTAENNVYVENQRLETVEPNTRVFQYIKSGIDEATREMDACWENILKWKDSNDPLYGISNNAADMSKARGKLHIFTMAQRVWDNSEGCPGHKWETLTEWVEEQTNDFINYPSFESNTTAWIRMEMDRAELSGKLRALSTLRRGW